MEDYKNMSNNQIMTAIQSLKAEHEAIKNRMLKDYDELEKVEREFNEANKILVKRIKGQTDE